MVTNTVSRMGQDDRGFTLTEMLIVLAMMGMVVGLMFLVLNTTSSWASRVDARGIATREMRLTVDRMSRDLRQASEIDEGAGVFAEAGARRCSFYVDLDHDGVPEKVTYYVDGNRVRRTVATASIAVPPYNFGADGAPVTLIGTLQTGWTGAVFTYFDSADPPASVTTIPDISAVRIHLINQASSGAETSVVDSLTWVKIRSIHNSISLRLFRGNHNG